MRVTGAQRTQAPRPAEAVRVAFSLLAVFLSAAIALQPFEAFSQNRRTFLPLIRDAEIESLIRDYAQPIVDAAGVGRKLVEVHLINDQTYNAFVTGRRMFIYAGAISESETPNELIGVIAHEIGHIKGGHLLRLYRRLEDANLAAAMSFLLGVGALAAGRNADPTGAVGSALIFGGVQGARNDLLAYRRDEELAADSASLEYLDASGQSAKGLIEAFKRLSGNVSFSNNPAASYGRTHPLSRDRIELLETAARKSQYYGRKDPPELQLRHDMARAKILAYSGNGRMIRGIFRDDPQGAAVRYGLAIAAFLGGAVNQALPVIDGLIAEQPANPYLLEMKGEMLLRSGRAKEAVPVLRKAIELEERRSGLLQVLLAHAMLESGGEKNAREAVLNLKRGLAREPNYARGYGLLARSYGALGEPHLARAAAAQEAFHQFRIKDAKDLAGLARKNLEPNTPEWVRMQDILDYDPKRR